MEYITSFNKGCDELIKSSDLAKIGIILIPTSLSDNWHKILIDKFKRHGVIISSNNQYTYTPPGTVGAKKRPRKEVIPEINNKELTYIIADLYFETGGTLNIALDRIIEQGIDKENLWFFTNGIHRYIGSNEEPFLDKADSFLEYRLKNRA